jgi:hypothetical protein
MSNVHVLFVSASTVYVSDARLSLSRSCAQSHGYLVQAANPYDTLVLYPGLYKQRVLCEMPVKIISLAMHTNPEALHAPGRTTAFTCSALALRDSTQLLPTHSLGCGGAGTSASGGGAGAAQAPAAAGARPCGPPPLAPPLTSSAVTFWQERPPVLLSNTDAVCLTGLTIRVANASHEYSSVAYGSDGRAITLEACHVMGGTGLRIPYSVDPLRILLLSLRSCVVQVRTLAVDPCRLEGPTAIVPCDVHFSICLPE